MTTLKKQQNVTQAAQVLKLTVKASKLIEALDFVSMVKPRSFTNQANSAAYLVRCAREPIGQPTGYVYSRGQSQVARAGFELLGLVGEGLFTLPYKHVDIIIRIPSYEDVTVESRTENRPEGEGFSVSIRSTSGTRYAHSTFDPRLIAPCDKDFASAMKNGASEHNVGILREAVARARAFLPDPKALDVANHFKTLQIFDSSNPACAQGDGTLFCADATRAFYFDCDEFKHRGLAVHVSHVPLLQEFLSRCQGATICRGANMSFVVNADKNHEKDQIVGWNHQATPHVRYFYYAMSRDKYVIIAPKRDVLGALDQAEILLERTQDRVKLVYTHRNEQTGGHTIHFGARESAGFAESFPVATLDKKDHTGGVAERSLEADFECLVSLAAFRSLIQDIVGPYVELRISPVKKEDFPPRGGAMVRTIEEIRFDATGRVISGGGASTTK